MSDWTAVERLYVGVAYALAWVTLIGYAAYVWRRARRAERALAESAPTGAAR